MTIDSEDWWYPGLCHSNTHSSFDFSQISKPLSQRGEIQYLIHNQHLFTREDFEAVMTALAEDGRQHQASQHQEDRSLALALLLEQPRQRIAPAPTFEDDLTALAVALREEIKDEKERKRNEEESLKFARHLMAQDLGYFDGVDVKVMQNERKEGRLV
jgi:hypothetical protein